MLPVLFWKFWSSQCCRQFYFPSLFLFPTLVNYSCVSPVSCCPVYLNPSPCVFLAWLFLYPCILAFWCYVLFASCVTGLFFIFACSLPVGLPKSARNFAHDLLLPTWIKDFTFWILYVLAWSFASGPILTSLHKSQKCRFPNTTLINALQNQVMGSH